MRASNVLRFKNSGALYNAVTGNTTDKLTAFYPGSFNPPTRGHIGVVAETALLAPKVIVGIGVNPAKAANQMFTPDERKKLVYVQTKILICLRQLCLVFDRVSGTQMCLSIKIS